MKFDHRWKILVLLFVCLPLGACRNVQEQEGDEEQGPATVEHLEGDEPTRVTLTEEAAKRLDIQTSPVQESAVGGMQRETIPYAAVLYDINGDTWTYTNPEPLVFFRHHIVVDHIEGDLVILAEGPHAGMAVVTVGAQELYGAEVEFEEE